MRFPRNSFICCLIALLVAGFATACQVDSGGDGGDFESPAAAHLVSGDAVIVAVGENQQLPWKNEWAGDWTGFNFSAGGIVGLTQNGRIAPPPADADALEALETAVDLTTTTDIVLAEEGNFFLAFSGVFDGEAPSGGVVTFDEQAVLLVTDAPDAPRALALNPPGSLLYIADAAASSTQGLFVVDLNDGDVRQLFFDAPLIAIEVADDGVAYAASPTALFAFDVHAETFALLWENVGSGFEISDLALGLDGNLYAAAGHQAGARGVLVRVDADTRAVETWSIGGSPTALAADATGMMFVALANWDGVFRVTQKAQISLLSPGPDHTGDLAFNDGGDLFVIGRDGFAGVIKPNGKMLAATQAGGALDTPLRLAIVP
jgi:hypothetical protein